MKSLRRKMLLCSTLLSPILTHAAEFNVINHENGSPLMVMQGKIEKGDHFKFKQMISSAPDNTKNVIFLNSNGGSLEEALLIAMELSFYNTSTVAMGDCLSACSVIFASGKDKYIPKNDLGFGEGNNRVGVHAPYVTIAGDTYSEQVGSSSWWKIYGILRGSGMSHQQVKDFLHYTYTTPSKNMTYITYKDVNVFGWVN
ncbi:hypothetical protein VPIG_00083 [Vibrio phage PWH3a-P1]|uniref:hypothetical protein n=1 Tax=Vibrio phage PWH3a-P1 TaxID=754058 RepID=UPI0002C09A9C|nr:hypothetical protein VPIG_00083 [Vibrio phage PWH3a-P1]AGH31941.1 hypothetical protein VPIG_00083 [Vibrio phage PWH3a-P1]